jgi:hypothetical protein
MEAEKNEVVGNEKEMKGMKNLYQQIEHFITEAMCENC